MKKFLKYGSIASVSFIFGIIAGKIFEQTKKQKDIHGYMMYSTENGLWVNFKEDPNNFKRGNIIKLRFTIDDKIR